MSRIPMLHDEMLMVGQLKQQAILSEILRTQEIQTVISEEAARKRFFLMFRIRSFLFRLAPRMAARHIL